jgi:hypothetical protein
MRFKNKNYCRIFIKTLFYEVNMMSSFYLTSTKLHDALNKRCLYVVESSCVFQSLFSTHTHNFPQNYT